MGQEFQEFDLDPAQEGPQAGPSWASQRWPVSDPAAEDELTRALDPMALKIGIAGAQKKAPRSSTKPRWNRRRRTRSARCC